MAGGQTRAKYGVVCTFENAHGDTYSIYRDGTILQAVRDACARALARDDSHRLVCYSTPETILADVRIRRADGNRGVNGPGAPVQCREASLLTRAGLPEMLHPRLAR